MAMGIDHIDRYVTSLRARLPLPPLRAAEVAEEVRGHLEDAARDLQMRGLTPHESEREAVRRFGAPEEIAGVVARAERAQRGQRRARTRGLVTATLAAAVLAALGGSAVASAYTPPASAGLRGAHTTIVRSHSAAHGPSVIRGGQSCWHG